MKFFTHEIASRNDDRIFELIDIHGLSGYGFFWVILEELYGSEENGFQIEATNIWMKRLARSLNITDDRTLVRYFDTLAELGLIDKQMWNEHIIYSQGVMKRSDAYMQRKAKEAEKKRKQRSQAKKAFDGLNTVPRDSEGTSIMSLNVPIADPYSYADPYADPNTEKENTKNIFSFSKKSDEKPIKIPDPMGDRFRSNGKAHYWQKELSDRQGTRWADLLIDWASSSDCKQGFKNSLIEAQILHLKKRELPHGRGDAIGSLCNYIKNSDLASFDLRADEAIAFEQSKASSAITTTKKKAYALPRRETWTDEQAGWSIERWEEFLSKQEEQSENTSYAY